MPADLKKDERNIVLTMLTETTDKGEFSQHVLQRHTGGLPRDEKGFVTRLYLGTLERVIYLDHIIQSFSNTKLNKMKPVIRNILRMSIYQMLFMDSVPDFAVLNEAARLTKKRGLKSLVPFVNGVLRSIQRKARSSEDARAFEKDMPENVRCSAPLWMYDLVASESDRQTASGYFKAALDAEGCIGILTNTLRCSKADLISQLEGEGCRVVSEDSVTGWFSVKTGGNITELAAYKNDLFYIQNRNSAKTGYIAAESRKGIKAPLIIDVCASPGGKSINAALRHPGCRIISRDISEEKVSLIEENKARLGLVNIETQVYDARQKDGGYKEKADLVIADLPCSGLGVIGEKPDIKLQTTPEDVMSLQQLQRDILENSWEMVRPGGTLVYSTCTINHFENADNTAWFINSHPFILEKEEQVIPADGTDGFYYAVMRRKSSQLPG